MSKKDLLKCIEDKRDNLGEKYRVDGGDEKIKYGSDDALAETLLLEFKEKVEELINE